ncbi:aminotransferase class-III family protein [Burkholderia gladioli]|uniref:Aminotransferase class-III family protein n=1 Tax=Burkholderia gladioli TaxID=28095 RepID=A0AAW3ERV1_BURGA|nr:aminotransferase class III-fold pyridoxal phosphate-dependent enzyme [Burkholderia gladioli]KGC10487.1 aminotransferase class-III family protein [Burkholderia gladioli]
MNELWRFASHRKVMELNELDPELRECVRDGDGVADHYGGRTPFTFVDQRGDEILLLERLADGRVEAGTAYNMTCGYGTGILGDDIRHLASGFTGFLDRATTTNDEFHSVERHHLVSRVKRLIASHTDTRETDWELTFTSTGSEAMDLALQLVLLDGFHLASGVDARRERDVVIACHGAWHGWVLGTNQMLDRRQFTDGLPRLANGQVVFMQYGNLDDLQAVFSAYRGRIRAAVVEGILGDGGVVRASHAWWEMLFGLCAKENVRLIDDEVLTGFRTGAMLALPRGRAPDCVTLGKALGFGLFPISAVAWRRPPLSLRAGVGVRTFNARPFQASVVDACLEHVEHHALFARSAELGERAIRELMEIARRYPSVFKAVRGQGLLIGIELADSLARQGRRIRDELLRNGVLTEIESGIFSRKLPRSARVNETLRLTPPLTVSESSLADAIQRIATYASRLAEQSNSHGLATMADNA